MANLTYPSKDDLEAFVGIISSKKYRISKFLPHIDQHWFRIINDCIRYVEHTSHYLPNNNFHDCCARLLYKIAKRHELGDGNKRSAVITVYIFSVLNDHYVTDPVQLKEEALRAARSKGRENEELLKRRMTDVLNSIIKPM